MTTLWREWGKPILVIVIVCCSVRSSVAEWHDVPTGSMKPTIIEGDRIFVNKLAYDIRVPFAGWRILEMADPARGDVVILFAPDSGIRLVKRIIGMPGDVIELRANRLLINGRAAEYGPLDADVIAQVDIDERAKHVFASERFDVVSHPIMITPGRAAQRSYGPVTVPDEQYFIMGDNRDNSRDSRAFGFVSRDVIIARVVGVVFSLDRDNHYAPRWDRFFRGLPD